MATKRWCIVCDSQLVTCKSYVRIKSVKVARAGFQEQLQEIFGDISSNSSDCICDRCVTKVRNVHKSIELCQELRDRYESTKRNHSHNLSSSISTPLKTISNRLNVGREANERSKRKIAFSPGTPTSRQQSKKLFASSCTRSPDSRALHCSSIKDKNLPNSEPSGTLKKCHSKRLFEHVESSKVSSKLSTLVVSDQQDNNHLMPDVPVQQHHKNKELSHSETVPALPDESQPESSLVSRSQLDSSGPVARESISTWSSATAALKRGDAAAAIQHVSKMNSTRDAFLNEVRQEAANLCKPSNESAFRDSSVAALEIFDFKKQAEELKQQAPTLLSVLEAAAETPRGERNTEKTKESSLPKIVTAAGILLNARSQNMNAHQVLNSLTLKEGCANKSSFSRMNSKGVCTSYKTALIKQTDCGKNYNTKVKEWARTIHEANEKEREIMKDHVADDYNQTRCDSSFTVAMDNVDMVIAARHPTRDNYGKDYHMVQMLGIKHRVNGHHLSTEWRTVAVEDIDSTKFLPTIEENAMLQRDWMILSAQIIAEHLPGLKQMMDALPKKIPHEHMSEMAKKSEVVNLGVLMENENTTDGIYKVMHHMHSYVPGHSTDQPTTVLAAGDLLSCERMANCIEEQRNSSTPSERLEGLMPTIADFHALANFYQIIWKHLYDASSGGNTGTLYFARNFLEARNVTSDPMKNVNAAEDLLKKYTSALVIAAAMDHFGLSGVEDEPTRHQFNLDKHGNMKQCAEEAMSKFVDKYMIPSTHDIKLDERSFICQYCQKKYVTRKGLMNHQRSKHAGEAPPSQPASAKASTDAPDSVLNYSRCALGMGMIALDFIDARQRGDGERLIRIYKFLMLHCRASGKPKYSYHILRLLAQVKCFLSPRLAYELVWNRTVNTKGGETCNVEVDRVVEHHNRIFKEHTHGLRGKITQESVDRVSRSAQTIHQLLARVDQQLEVRRPSSSRQSTGHNDVTALALVFSETKLFDERPGRMHSSFPNFPATLLSSLRVPELHKWICSTLKALRRQNQFSAHKQTTPT